MEAEGWMLEDRGRKASEVELGSKCCSSSSIIYFAHSCAGLRAVCVVRGITSPRIALTRGSVVPGCGPVRLRTSEER